MDTEMIRRLAVEHGLTAVRVGAVDTVGVWRGKRVPIEVFLADVAVHGTHMCDAVLCGNVGDELLDEVHAGGYPNVGVRPDLSTFMVTPWVGRTAAVLGDFVEADGGYTPLGPRHVLRTVVDRLAAAGYSARIGYELEFHLFAEDSATALGRGFAGLTPVAPGLRTYGVARLAALEPVIGTMADQLRAAGIDVEAAGTDYDLGQFELNLGATDPMRAADQAVLYKHAVREIAAGLGLTATFMARCDDRFGGNSGHIHQSLWRDGENVFGLDDLTLHQFVAGQLITMPELTALFNPSPNSYKRRTPYSFAPMSATWGGDNRTVALRVLDERPDATRVEHRLCGADVNPYLAIAACLAGGLYGIEQRLEPPPATTGNAYNLDPTVAPALPANLTEAIIAMEEGKLAAELLGNDLVARLLALRRVEAAAAAAAVTDWERQRYFELS